MDIISNLIQGKNIIRLLHQDTAFKLPLNSNIQNKYADSLVLPKIVHIIN